MSKETNLAELRQCIDLMEKTFGADVTRDFFNKQIYGVKDVQNNSVLWAARDYNGYLKLYTSRPVRKGDKLKEKMMFLSENGYWMNANMISMPNVTWENSPVLVSLRVMAAADIEDIKAEE